MMQTDVKAVHLDASGVGYAGRTRVRGYQVAPGLLEKFSFLIMLLLMLVITC